MRSFNDHVARVIIAILLGVAMLGTTAAPATAQGESRSDLAIKLIWAPKYAKACETFKEIYIITNRGPSRATNVNVQIGIPDPFGVIKITGTPINLAPGKSVIVVATIKVVAFVPGESRNWTISASVSSDVYPDISIDPKPGNNQVTRSIKLISKPVLVCP